MPHVLAQDLRNAVLQAAMSGKLTQRLETDSDAYDLYKNIQNKKSIKGKTKTEIEFEIPYDIPDYWASVKLGDTFDVIMGSSPKGEELSDDPANGIEFHQGKIAFTDWLLRPSGVYTSSKSKIAPKNSVLLCVRAPIGKVNVTDREIAIGRGLCSITPVCDMSINYLMYLLRSLEKTFIDKGTGSTFKAITSDVVFNQLIPLPPIEEQARIVARVDELMAKIDEYEKIEKELVKLQKVFPGNMKDAILRAAMQGKLTEQLESDGNVHDYLDNVASLKASLIKEKKLKKDKTTNMVEEEYPFDIPENWAWTKLGIIANLRPGKTPPRAEPTWWGKENDVPWVSIADMVADGHVSKTKEFISQAGFKEKFKSVISPAGTMIMSFKLTVGRVSYLNIDALHNEAIISIFPFMDENDILRSYLFKVLPYLTEYGDSKNAIKGTTLNADSLCNLYIPLPPIKEQQRIVDKLDHLLPLCEQLERMTT